MLLPGSIEILLIVEQAIVRAGIRKLIESQPEMRVVGEAGSCHEALTIVANKQPDIILLELDTSDENDLGVIPRLAEIAKQSQIITLTSVRQRHIHISAVRLGVKGLVHKDQDCETLFTAIKRVYNGEVWLERTLMAEVIMRMSSKDPRSYNPEAEKIATLTPREHQVITLVAQGLKNKQIAAHLFISETSVRHYLTIIFNKLNLSHRLELATYAYSHGLARLPVSNCN